MSAVISLPHSSLDRKLRKNLVLFPLQMDEIKAKQISLDHIFKLLNNFATLAQVECSTITKKCCLLKKFH